MIKAKYAPRAQNDVEEHLVILKPDDLECACLRNLRQGIETCLFLHSASASANAHWLIPGFVLNELIVRARSSQWFVESKKEAMQ